MIYFFVQCGPGPAINDDEIEVRFMNFRDKIPRRIN